MGSTAADRGDVGATPAVAGDPDGSPSRSASSDTPSTAGAGDRPARLPKPALAIALLCLAINAVIVVGAAIENPDYLRDYRLNSNPDAIHYVRLGCNWLLLGHYSRCDSPPYVPDMIRTPVYPLLAGGLDLLGGAGAIYMTQAVLQAFSCLLLFALVRPWFGLSAAVGASLLLATDLMLAVYNFEAMSEPLFYFLVLLAVYLLVPAAERWVTTGRGPVGRLVLCGLTLGLAILTRPTALYLPVVVVVTLLGLGLWHRRPRAALTAAALVLLAAVPLPAAWVARNAAVFGVARLSTVDAVATVYFLGGGGYQLHHGVSLEEAHARIANEFHLPRHEEAMNPWTCDRSVAEIDAALRAATGPVLTRYPREMLQAAALGVAKASVSHNTGQLAGVLGRQWLPPGLGDLARLRPAAFARLWDNGPVLVGSFAWQCGHTLIALTGGLVGLLLLVRRHLTRPAGFLLLGMLGYCYLTVAAFGLEAFYRCRIPALPFLYVCAGIGLADVAGRVRRRVGGGSTAPRGTGETA
jgi:hypothetical protein